MDTISTNEGDQLECIRHLQQQACNALSDEQICTIFGAEQWTTDALLRDFVVEGFVAPYVVVRRKSDRQRGSLMFRHLPRVYFAWAPYEEES